MHFGFSGKLGEVYKETGQTGEQGLKKTNMETDTLQPVENLASTPQARKTPPLGYRITKENAQEFARISWEARRKREAEQANQAKAGREATPQSVQLAKQIKQIEDLMDGETDPDTLLKLSGAHARLFSAWQVLTGTPNPGARRTGKRERAPAIQPEPEPVQAVTPPVTQAPESGPKA